MSALRGGLIQFVLSRNEEQSAAFRSASARLSRTRYRAEHPTELAAWKCMDGRLNLALYTKTPHGIIQPFRNMGGQFDLGWAFFQEVIRGWVNYSLSRGRRVLILVTYHYSKGDSHRGCAGFSYDTGLAHKAAEALAVQAEGVFGTQPRMVYPIVVGVETDEEALILHGAHVENLEMAALSSLEGLEERVRDLYPDMDLQMVQDFLPLLRGNWEHIHEVRASNRAPIELEHREQIIALGRGFDWLHMPNKALIIGPYSHAWPDAVATAGSIILSNFNESRVPREEGVLLLISTLSRDEEGSFGWNMAIEKSKYLQRTALKVLNERVPELKDSLQVLAGVTSADTRKLHELV